MDSRLKTYVLTATGTATLATAGIANADIITSSGGPVDITANAGPTTLFTLAGGNVKVSNEKNGIWSSAVPGGYALARLFEIGATAAMTTVASGASIGAGLSGYTSAYAIMYFGSSTMSSSRTSGLPLGSSILMGFSITNGAETYYGWIDYSLSMFEGEYTFTINSWAYNDVADQGIIAGQNTAAGSSAVPGLGGLAALAIGAAGVRSRRQRTVA